MDITLHKSSITNLQYQIVVTGSKSESNRLLLLQALYPNIQIQNLSNADDTLAMQQGLITTSNYIDVHHAGTAMRFLTAYFATKEDSDLVITGSARMKERPIKILVEALNNLGANITYLEKEGCPPLKIKGTKITNHRVALNANVSSQYISALLLIAPSLKNGLTLKLKGEITSLPYIQMTLSLLNQIGIPSTFKNNTITINHYPVVSNKNIIIESDWSSASYFYSLVALSEIGTKITLASYKENSLQGDIVLVEIYRQFGVETSFQENTLCLLKASDCKTKTIKCQLKNAPDIAQTIAVTCFGLGISCILSGLHTLKIKETDRLVALKTELEKLGATVNITDDSLHLETATKINNSVTIETYNDHRMAMAFAPLALKTTIKIKEADVVSKSYPSFWEDLKTLKIQIS